MGQGRVGQGGMGKVGWGREVGWRGEGWGRVEGWGWSRRRSGAVTGQCEDRAAGHLGDDVGGSAARRLGTVCAHGCVGRDNKEF